MESVYIVGFMGAGKTAVSELVAQKLNISTIDTDDIIETKLERTINQIFEEYGEAYFRQLEHIVLKGVIKENRVITTGGGIVIQEINRQYLKKKQNVIYLKVSAETVLERLKEDTTRPLLQKEDKYEEIKRLLESRTPWYEEVATFTVDTDGKTLEEVATIIVEHISK